MNAIVDSLPAELKKYSGQILDIDSHEMMPAQVWVREIGEIAKDLADHWQNNSADMDRTNHPNVAGYDKDDAPIEADTIWLKKGRTAPGAVDVTRRDEVMDVMGVKRQLMFPTGVGLYGTLLAYLGNSDDYALEINENRLQYGMQLIDAHNDWAVKVTTDRVRSVAVLLDDTPEGLYAKAKDLIDRGIRAVMLPTGSVPGGKSPAHPVHDPLWDLFARNNIAVTLHTLIEEDVYNSREWSNAPAFEGFKLYDEFKLDPWSRANNHILAQNFLATMVLGGVFQRHPMLRFGVVELGAFWIGHLCETLDFWHDSDPGGVKFRTTQTVFLDKRPSEYIKSNVRVSAFEIENVEFYISKYGLEDVLCFASDYPHIEGGKDPVGKWYAGLKPLGDEVVEKFFVRNGQWLLPD